jgi:hypothetical protein
VEKNNILDKIQYKIETSTKNKCYTCCNNKYIDRKNKILSCYLINALQEESLDVIISVEGSCKFHSKDSPNLF